MGDLASLAAAMTESGTRVDEEQLTAVSRLIAQQPEEMRPELAGALGLDGVMPTLNARHAKRTRIAR